MALPKLLNKFSLMLSASLRVTPELFSDLKGILFHLAKLELAQLKPNSSLTVTSY